MCIVGYLLSILNETNDREYYTKGPTGSSCGFWTENIELAAIFATKEKAIAVLEGDPQSVKSILRTAGKLTTEHPYERLLIEIKPISIGATKNVLSTFVMFEDGHVNHSPIEHIEILKESICQSSQTAGS